jgi:hypothetical protein
VGARTRALREREATFAAEPPERIGDAATFIFAEGLATGGLAVDVAGRGVGPGVVSEEPSPLDGYAAEQGQGTAFSFSFSFPPNPLVGWGRDADPAPVAPLSSKH